MVGLVLCIKIADLFDEKLWVIIAIGAIICVVGYLVADDLGLFD